MPVFYTKLLYTRYLPPPPLGRQQPGFLTSTFSGFQIRERKNCNLIPIFQVYGIDVIIFPCDDQKMSKVKESFGGFSKPVSTYADYIEATFHDKYDRYAWLVDFLRNRHPKSLANNLPFPVQVSILDSEKESLKSRRFTVATDDPIDPHLVNALKEPGSCQTRLIFLQYQSFESINPTCIDLIGLHCGLHPDFFSVHFECDFDQTGQVIAHFPSHSLPSERRFLQIRTDEWTFMTATWKVCEDRCICELNPASIFPNVSFCCLMVDFIPSCRFCARSLY